MVSSDDEVKLAVAPCGSYRKLHLILLRFIENIIKMHSDVQSLCQEANS